MRGFRDDFSDMVMSWSLQDILNEDLYRNQVEKIPTTFESVPQYLSSFIYPLLEETRAELASKLKSIHDAPFSKVTSSSEAKKFGKGAYRVNVDYWRNKVIDHGKETYKTLPGDLVIISSAKPESVSDLQRTGWKWTFASVKKISNSYKEKKMRKKERDEPTDEPLDFVVQILKGSDFEISQWPLSVVYLTNLTTNKRIWSSLHMDTGSSLIQQALLRSQEDEENIYCNKCSSGYNSCWEDYTYPGLISGLNDSQIGAICSSLQKVKCDNKCSAQLIWGPPGTGKTKTLSLLLFVLLQMNIQTLVCAPTNIAVKEVASRVLSIVRDSLIPAKGNRPPSLSHILLLGNEERLKVSGEDIEQIYLDHRVERLNECFGEGKGWKISVCCMIDFFKNPFSDCHVPEEPEIIGKEGLSAFFLRVIQEKFEYASSLLRRRISVVFTHLPTNLILEQNSQDMVQALSLMDLIERSFKDNLVAKELEELFSQGDTIEHASNVFESATSLSLVRKECLALLKDLLCAFDELPTQLEELVEKLCFRSASLIFCTTSTSYNLQFKDVEPIELLVIDEAAQLKECEYAIPLQLPGVKDVILIGDECQLPALVNSKVCVEAQFGRSLFERLSLIGYSKQLLNIQYRMHPSISCFPNFSFYSNKIIDAPHVKSEAHQRTYIPGGMFGPYSFINVEDGKEELDDVSHSRRNFVEVAMVVKLVQNLYKEWKTSKEKLSVGVISPYAAQVAAIKGKLSQTYPDGFTVNVKSVDGFQGGEQDIIILSTVRSNNDGSIGFLSNWQRTNVALTRARHCLWILGNEATLRKGQSVWSSLVQDAKSRGCLFDAHQDKSIKTLVLQVKKELDQLDDLLNTNSVLFSNARWKVVFSHNFRKSFSKHKSSRVRKTILNVLLKLAGGWRPQRTTVDIVCDCSKKIVKQFFVEGKYIVCTIEIVKDVKYTQVLKAWDLMALEEIPKFVHRLDNIFCMYTDDYISCCNEKYSEGKLEVPMSWETSYDIIQFKTSENDKDGGIGEPLPAAATVVENSSVNESLLLMKFYSLSSLTASYLLSEQSGVETDLPFEVTDEEWEVIKFNKSAFVLGRSGTGKTTILTMKLFHKEQLQHLVSEGFDSASCGTPALWSSGLVHCVTEGSVLRQIFVTVSPKLCRAVKKHITDLVRFTHGETLSSENIANELDDMDETVLLGDIPDSFASIPAEKYPLVITFRKFLMMLDRSIGVSYFSRFRSVAELTVNSIAFQNFMRTREVNFERFCSVYWPHFNRTLTKSLDPLRVFTEMMSHIKGSSKGAGEERVLSREDYVLLSDGRTSTLTPKLREEIYDIFQSYEKMKSRNCEFDVADIVIDLHHRMEKDDDILQSPKMDFVYIDEVQDLTMSQISLFKHICSNVEEGFVFSGDTAQTIARGIDFRFEDIRCLFYNNFLMGSESESAKRAEKGLITDTFNLRRNFRTHTGVLMLAQSVIRLLYHFFPQSIDILKPETSLIYGEPPVLLEPCSDENAILSIFGDVKGSGSAMVGFGAEQVILVRDDDVKEEVCRYIGGKALVLTVLECKGLEFQDVLLYNFFGSSPLRNEWRVVYEFMEQHNLLDSTSKKSFPNFNHARHSLMCSELKHLYVAITRTRQRLWISENSDEFSMPFLEYWKKLGLVQVRVVDKSLIETMQVASSSQEWQRRAIKLLWEGNYEMAMLCFERAGDKSGQKMAKASSLKALASRLEDNKKDQALREAAELYVSIGKADLAAECFIDLGDFKEAGKIYFEKGGKCDMRKAGECFRSAHCFKLAAKSYAEGNHFAECLAACMEGDLLNKDGDLLEKGLEYIGGWKRDISVNSEHLNGNTDLEKVAHNYLEKCAIKKHACKNMQAMMLFVRAFDTIVLRRKFLRSVGCLDELLKLEEESGNFFEAAEIASELGNSNLQANLLFKGNRFTECLVACMEGELLDKGMQYILGWKGDTSVIWNAELVGVANNILEKGAIKNHASKNMHGMMEFVRAFDTIVLRRKFLRSVDCLEELIKLEEESGNSLEAAGIADELGNSPLQANLLFKAGLLKESTILILWHVFANSLWNSGGGGWPLKPFPQKENLLLKSKSIAAEEGGKFSELIGTEAGLLSHGHNKISTLGRYFGASVQHQCLRGQFISVRKILDVHFQLEAPKFVWGDELPCDLEKESLQRILSNQMSAATLIHFWNHLSTIIVNIYKSVHDIDGITSDDNGVVEFFLNYFGVRRQAILESTRYRLLMPDAQWVKKMNVSVSVSKCGKFSYVDKPVFVLAVQNYWQAELVSAGLKVLETLRLLYNFSQRGAHIDFRQSICLVYIYKVTRFLQECNLSYWKINERKFQEFCQLSHEFVFKVFRLDWRQSLTRTMVCFRQNQEARDLLSEIILTSTRSPLTYGRIGRVIMIFLGSGRFTDELHREIGGRFLEGGAWKEVFEVLSQTRKSEPLCENLQVNRKMKSRCYQDDMTRGRGNAQDRISIIIKFQKALEATYCGNWKEIDDYISPNCFTYLIDRLVILSSSGFKEIFYTLKSSFTEWILHEEPDTYHRSFTLLPDAHFRVQQRAYDFAIKIITELLFSIEDAAEWIRRSAIDPNYYLPLLFLRLVVLLVLLCLNSGSYFHCLKQILDDNCINFHLPPKFYDLLYRATCCGLFDIPMVAEALETIGDPLVIVSFTESSPQLTAHAAIFMDMVEKPHKDEIFDILFPRGIMDQHEGVSILDPIADAPEVSGELSSVGESSEMSSTAVISSSIPPVENKESSNENVDKVFNWDCFEKIHDLLKAGGNLNEETFVRFDFKEKVEESITCVTSAIALPSSNECLSDGDINATAELKEFLEELNDLSSVLSSRNEEFEENVRRIVQLLGKLVSRRPLLESFFNEVLGIDEPVDWELESDAKCDQHEEINRESESTEDGSFCGPKTKSDDRKQETGNRDGEGMVNARAEGGHAKTGK